MKKIRAIPALLLCLCLGLCLNPAFAAGSSGIGSFTMPDGMTAHTRTGEDMTAPDGLQDLYDLMMGPDTDDSAVYLLRAPAGRVLVSIAATPVREVYSVETLLAASDEILTAVFGSADVGTVEQCGCYGYDGVSISGVRTLNGAHYQLDGLLFQVESNLLEVWKAHPTEQAYLFNDTAAAELQSDLECAEQLLSTITFKQRELPRTEAAPCEVNAEPFAGSGFSLSLPEGTVQLNADSSEEAWQAARDAFAAVGGPEAGTLLDQYRGDTVSAGSQIFVLPGHDGLVEVTGVPTAVDYSPNDIADMAGVFTNEEQERSDFALCVDSGSLFAAAGGDFCLMTLFIRNGDYSIVTDALMMTHDGCFWEIDLVTPALDGETLRNQLLYLLQSTLAWTK